MALTSGRYSITIDSIIIRMPMKVTANANMPRGGWGAKKAIAAETRPYRRLCCMFMA